MSQIDEDLQGLKEFGSVIGLGMLTGVAVLIAGAFVYLTYRWAVANPTITLVTVGVIVSIAIHAILEDE